MCVCVFVMPVCVCVLVPVTHFTGDTTYSCVWHDSFTGVTASFVLLPVTFFVYVSVCIVVFVLNYPLTYSCKRINLFTFLNCKYKQEDQYWQHDSVILLVHACDMTHSCV